MSNQTPEEVSEKYKKYQKEWRSKPENILWKKNYMDKYREQPDIVKHEREYQKERRHRLGISKKYREDYSEFSKTKEYKKLYRIRYRALRKVGGELTIEILQLIYEDNIKRFGTLTCYLCLKPIPFGKDEIEHKIPLSKGGTNEYCNLGIACERCNCKKYNKTEEEYRKGMEII